jgi:uncharacterized protein (TIGR02246 family)
MSHPYDHDVTRQLLDLEEIKRLKARYFRTVDQQDWEAWARVFAKDVVMEVPEADIVLRGRDTIVQAISGTLTGARTVHHGHMPEIEFTGRDTARGIWAMFDYIDWLDAESGKPTGTGYGHYYDEYVREDGEWRIASTKLVRLRVDYQ